MTDRLAEAELYMVRHAQTMANWRGEYLDDSDPLSPVGKLQAALLARRVTGLSIGLIVHSGTLRTMQTAAAVAKLKPGAKVVEDLRLREGRTGKWTGQTLGNRLAEARRLNIPVWLVRPPGGESWVDIDERISAFSADLKTVYGTVHSLIVGQGRINSLILRQIDGIPWENYSGQQQRHTGLTHVVWSPLARICLREDVSHLPQHLQTI
jgi:broad specificity phosphatase PhoE